jgi:hypothetical protein
VPLTPAFLAAIGLDEALPGLRSSSASERIVSLRALKASANSPFAPACRNVDRARATAQRESARTAAMGHSGMGGGGGGGAGGEAAGEGEAAAAAAGSQASPGE